MMPVFIEKVLKLFRSAPKIERMGFLSSFFRTEEQDFTDAEMVDIDIVRTDEEVAPVLKDYRTGAVAIAEDVFTGKQIKPPIYSLERPVNIFELMKRQPGENAFGEIGSWWARLVLILKAAFLKEYEMLKRAIELQASQILQTGKLTLLDDKGNAAYVLDYKPKVTHFPTVAAAWGTSGADPLGDIEALADVIRDDGLTDVRHAIFGQNAWNNFIKDNDVRECWKKDALGLGALFPRMVDRGGKYMGYIEIGSYRIDCWVYNGRYKNFHDAATKYPFVDPNKVILLSSEEDLDFRLVYGGIPTMGMDEPFREIIPEIVRIDGAIEYHNRVYKDQKGDVYVGESKIRPICIPVSIDRFGCLTTTPSTAVVPTIGTQPQDDESVSQNDSKTLDVVASASDGGTLTYQWYSNTSKSNVGGTPISGATGSQYTVPTSSTGTFYFYCVITNTKNGTTAAVASNAVKIVVS